MEVMTIWHVVRVDRYNGKGGGMLFDLHFDLHWDVTKTNQIFGSHHLILES